MVKTGLEIIAAKLPAELKGKKAGILCHAPSITAGLDHIADIFSESSECTLTALFGPQHGIHGQTQDNMIEWEGGLHPYYHVPLYSYMENTGSLLPLCCRMLR